MLLQENPCVSTARLPGYNEAKVIHFQAHLAEKHNKSKIDQSPRVFLTRFRKKMGFKGILKINSSEDLNFYLFGQPLGENDENAAVKFHELSQVRKELKKKTSSCKEIIREFLIACADQNQRRPNQKVSVDRCVELFGKISKDYQKVLTNNPRVEILGGLFEKSILSAFRC